MPSKREKYITEINYKHQNEEGMINEPTKLRKEIVRINKLMEPTGKQCQHNLYTHKKHNWKRTQKCLLMGFSFG